MSLFVRETRHPASLMSNLLSSFPRKRMPRMVRIKDTTCGFPPLFSLAPLFSSPSNDEKCSWVFVIPAPFTYLLSLSCLLYNPLSISLFFQLSLIPIFVFRGLLPNTKAPKIVLEMLFLLDNKGKPTRISVKILPNGFEIARRKLHGRRHYNGR